MSNNQNRQKEASRLVEKIKNFDFVSDVRIDNTGKITWKNFNDTLTYNKSSKQYTANKNICGQNYRIFIRVIGDKPNPKYERKLRKIVS